MEAVALAVVARYFVPNTNALIVVAPCTAHIVFPTNLQCLQSCTDIPAPFESVPRVGLVLFDSLVRLKGTPRQQLAVHWNTRLGDHHFPDRYQAEIQVLGLHFVDGH